MSALRVGEGQKRESLEASAICEEVLITGVCVDIRVRSMGKFMVKLIVRRVKGI